jgi:hypothetical protein
LDSSYSEACGTNNLNRAKRKRIKSNMTARLDLGLYLAISLAAIIAVLGIDGLLTWGIAALMAWYVSKRHGPILSSYVWPAVLIALIVFGNLYGSLS